MTKFFNRVVSSFFGDRRRATPGVLLGAFGKHPGWGDHIRPPLGLDGRLGEVMECLYLAGIERNCIPTWASQDPAQLVPMGHLFVWHLDGETVVIGRLWQSRDASQPPRTQYPMVIAAQFNAVPLARALDSALPGLELLETQCRQTEDPGRVIALVDAAREALAGDVALMAPENGSPQPDALTALGRSSAMAGDPEQLARVLHVLEGIDADARRQTYGTPIRVPRVGSGEREEVLTWRGLIEQRFGPLLPSLVLLPVDREWADVIVGRPDPSHFCRLRMTPSLTPLTTDIPYTLTAVVEQQARLAISAGLGDGSRPDDKTVFSRPR